MLCGVLMVVVVYSMGFRFFHNGCGHSMTVIVIAESTHDQFHTHGEQERGKKCQQGFDATAAVMEPYISPLFLSCDPIRTATHATTSDTMPTASGPLKQSVAGTR